jgi:hypothetical protein
MKLLAVSHFLTRHFDLKETLFYKIGDLRCRTLCAVAISRLSLAEIKRFPLRLTFTVAV